MSETKTDQSRTRNDEGQSQERPDAETKVTEGEEGMRRFRRLLAHVVPSDASEVSK